MGEPYSIEWKIDRVEAYWYFSGRYAKTYVEITFWYDPVSCVRKETVRSYEAQGNYNLPDWAHAIQTRNKYLEND